MYHYRSHAFEAEPSGPPKKEFLVTTVNPGPGLRFFSWAD